MTDLLLNPADQVRREVSAELAKAYGPETVADVRAALGTCPAHGSTPLADARELAADLGLESLWIKDERDRMGLASFKAVGGAYAVLELAAEAASRALGRKVSIKEVVNRRSSPAVALTFTSATAGNHGRSVAAGAALAGARCVIFVYDGVPEDQIAAIAAEGAEIERVGGVYDDAVDACRAAAARNGWVQVSDTAWEGYEAIPERVQRGYALIGGEAAEQAPSSPTHLFLQAGCGGLACVLAAQAGLFWTPAPKIVIVEPDAAPCLLESARAGRPVLLSPKGGTTMGRLDVYSPSLTAWRLIEGLADAYLSVSDAQADAAVRRLAAAGYVTSPSGGAGVAGLLAALADPSWRRALALGPDSRVLVFLTEKPTARDLARLSAANLAGEGV